MNKEELSKKIRRVADEVWEAAEEAKDSDWSLSSRLKQISSILHDIASAVKA